MNEKQELSHYVSDTEGDVYAIQGLPEEVLAVVFAYVSRSPRGFRENLLEVTKERAQEFHQKWVLEYGHASVAEHAVVHLGVERLSRYASGILEESRLISVTEYSQRYQEPGPDAFHFPRGLAGTDLAEPARRLFRDCYALYRRLLEGLSDHLDRQVPRREREADDARRRRLRRLAFEDARYVLPLATTTSLGLTANARELEYLISKLLTHPAAELVRLGESLRDEAARVAPTLIRYAAPLPYVGEIGERAENEAGALRGEGCAGEPPAVRLAEYSGRPADVPPAEVEPGISETQALRRVVEALILPRAGAAAESVRASLSQSTREGLAERFARLIGSPGPHDPVPRALETVHYTFDLLLSEAAWHQLVRHRMMSSFPAEPRADAGITIPPRVTEAALEALVREAADMSAALWRQAMVGAAGGAPYLVTNAHRRRVRVTLDLRELYHLVMLRLSPSAQWDIREVVGEMVAEARRVHPSLVGPAVARGEKRDAGTR